MNFKQSDYLWVKFKQKDHLWVNFKQKDHLWVNFKHFRPSVGTPLFSQFWVVLVDTKHATSVCESLLGGIGAYKTRNECMRMLF